MKFKLLIALSFITTMVMAQPKPATPPPVEKPVAINIPPKPATAPQQQSQKPPVPAPQKRVGSVPPHNIGDF
jgi:hypothetical protein